MNKTPIPEDNAPGADAAGGADGRLRAAEERIEALLSELREIEARNRFDSDALAHFRAQLVERDDIIQRQTADIAQLKSMLAAANQRKSPPSVASAMKTLTGSLSLSKRK